MSWFTPKIWKPKDVATAALLNQQWRDNMTELTTTSWTAPTLVNSWANYGGEYQAAGYRKIGGVVILRGLVTNGTAAAIFTLPTGFRPGTPQELNFMVLSGDNDNGFGIAQSRIRILTNGEVSAQTVEFNAGVANWVSLAQVMFPAD